ncbi:MAG: hypothetical protein KDJ90_22985 [Nitratireductor sp.]|nr:hypothetical protein [Nitratireductor sp.]
MLGDAYDDVIFGFGGNDTLDGGAGEDILHGGAGLDSLTGGADADIFVFSASDGSDVDVIADYVFADNDAIDLSDYLGGTPPTTEITFQTVGSDSLLLFNASPIVQLTGVTSGMVNIIYDDLQNSSQVTIA